MNKEESKGYKKVRFFHSLLKQTKQISTVSRTTSRNCWHGSSLTLFGGLVPFRYSTTEKDEVEMTLSSSGCRCCCCCYCCGLLPGVLASGLCLGQSFGRFLEVGRAGFVDGFVFQGSIDMTTTMPPKCFLDDSKAWDH